MSTAERTVIGSPKGSPKEYNLGLTIYCSGPIRLSNFVKCTLNDLIVGDIARLRDRRN